MIWLLVIDSLLNVFTICIWLWILLKASPLRAIFSFKNYPLHTRRSCNHLHTLQQVQNPVGGDGGSIAVLTLILRIHSRLVASVQVQPIIWLNPRWLNARSQWMALLSIFRLLRLRFRIGINISTIPTIRLCRMDLSTGRHARIGWTTHKTFCIYRCAV